MAAAMALLVFLSVLVAFAGFMMLSQATFGVGLLAFAILLAVFGRIAQAAAYHKEMTDVAKQKIAVS